jgi:hypothetical protein
MSAWVMSGHMQCKGMSALPPKADMCGATRDADGICASPPRGDIHKLTDNVGHELKPIRRVGMACHQRQS